METSRTFTMLVHDDRYSVPTLVFANAESEQQARELAAQELDRSEHHLAVDVQDGEAASFRVRRIPAR